MLITCMTFYSLSHTLLFSHGSLSRALAFFSAASSAGGSMWRIFADFVRRPGLRGVATHVTNTTPVKLLVVCLGMVSTRIATLLVKAVMGRRGMWRGGGVGWWRRRW